ncbi:MAG: putative peptidoglycan binding domain, partial [Candidatus Parcubacteria bacterium]
MCTDLPRNLHRGMESVTVSFLQSFLLEKGFLEGEATGFYGDNTVDAVKAYQSAKDLPVTGMVYDFTREAIRAETCQ